MKIIKIKFAKDGSPTITYETTTKSGMKDTITLVSSELPAPEFKEAIESLARDVVSICELSKGDVEKITVTGLSLSHPDDNTPAGAVISASRRLLNSDVPMVLNTPFKWPPVEGKKAGGKKLFSPETADRVEAAQKLAKEFVKGKRLQRSLFNGDAK